MKAKKRIRQSFSKMVFSNTQSDPINYLTGFHVKRDTSIRNVAANLWIKNRAVKKYKLAV
jgi:hypothetical protein